ncbi:GtrA family protein [Corynebacterium amycolatum]|uniref:GtrA family protein n=1 Tax=Corynebacterium amycolatum TaxID=43765 RepID=UPI000E117869|nr:GtrA family protein [Corynebacterium amycolatum]STB96336.1 GtrA-like integral membrane protein [Corynebacterium amycolatum]
MSANEAANENPNRENGKLGNGSHENGFVVEDSAAVPMATETKDEHGLKVQMMRFIISGVIAAVVDFGLTFIMLNAFGATNFWGKTVGWVFGTITAYIINSRWTFKSKSSAKKVLAVAVLYLITYATQVGIFNVLQPWLVESWGWNAQWAQFGAFVVAQGVATVINFIIQRVFIFRVK